MNPVRRTLWLYCFLALLAGPLLAAEYAGRVVGVSDGDTMTLLVPDGTSFKQVRVRLGEIDTPESRQPYGTQAKQALSALAFGYPAQVVMETITPMAARAGVRGRNRRECGKGEARHRVRLAPLRAGSSVAATDQQPTSSFTVPAKYQRQHSPQGARMVVVG